jgi:hypothetical protein
VRAVEHFHVMVFEPVEGFVGEVVDVQGREC